MRALIQRVNKAEVFIDNKRISQINRGLLILLGISQDDNEQKIEPLISKIINLRIFDKQDKAFELSLKEAGGELLVVSQFTLFADTRKGRRPSFSQAAKSQKAGALYETFIKACQSQGVTTKQGQFGAYMQVSLINDGPVTILIDA